MSSGSAPRGGASSRKMQRNPERSAKTERVGFGARLPPDLIKDVRREALERDQTVQEFVEIALRTALGRPSK